MKKIFLQKLYGSNFFCCKIISSETGQKNFGPKSFCWNFVLVKNLLGRKYFFGQKFFCWTIISSETDCKKKILVEKYFGRKFFSRKLFLLQNHFLENSLDEKQIWSKNY